MGFGLGSGSAPLEIGPADYEAFERLLGEVQAAWSNEDVEKLHTLATPEMVSYFSKDLEENKARNDVNKVSDVKLLQGDLAESWREGETDYASVAMRFSLVDKTLERGTGRVVAGSDTPVEATEVWTFARRRGGNWELSAIQQTN
jgi:predicted lipid-binding transport protein (Tim44 family)